MRIFFIKLTALYCLVFIISCVHCKKLYFNDSLDGSIKFFVHTRQNTVTPELITPDVESIVRSILNPLKPTTFAIHGIQGNKSSEESLIIMNSKLKVEDANVILVDYSTLNNNIHFEDVFTSAKFVAKATADLIILLRDNFNINLKNIHIVGFSFGGQIAGIVGQYVFEYCGEKVKRITGLDPAGIVFSETTSDNEKLTSDDADYVEVVHTNAGKNGYSSPSGHVDYYVNGGKIQHGCNITDNICSHNRVYELVPEMWYPVENLEFLLLKCENVDYMSLDNCRWRNEKMGALEKQLKGLYYVETNSNRPFGKGAFKSHFL